jgi:hypothetical protein
MRKAARPRFIIGTGVMLALLAAVVTVAATSGSPAATASSSSASVVQAPSSSLVAQLGVLRRARTASDELPAVVAASLNEHAPIPPIAQKLVAAGEKYAIADRLPESGANPDLARLAGLSPHGKPVYTIPALRGVCVLTIGGAQRGCDTQEQVETGETVETVLCEPGVIPANEIEISGVLADGATDTAVVLSNGQSAPLQVTNNVYVADYPRSGPLPTTVSWTDASGKRHSASTNLPSGVATEVCAAAPAAN